jgi:hypothetical protein
MAFWWMHIQIGESESSDFYKFKYKRYFLLTVSRPPVEASENGYPVGTQYVLSNLSSNILPVLRIRDILARIPIQFRQ